jgi:endonuclease YncB( thermonuclease family)
VQVSRIVDGDTLVVEVEGVERTIRLIGVDTPESVHPTEPVEPFSREASQFLSNLLLGESVYIVHDTATAPEDRYGRTLAYLHRWPDGLFVNLEIVRQGYGKAYLDYPFEYLDLFSALESKARDSGKGLWAGMAPDPFVTVSSGTKLLSLLEFAAAKHGVRYSLLEESSESVIADSHAGKLSEILPLICAGLGLQAQLVEGIWTMSESPTETEAGPTVETTSAEPSASTAQAIVESPSPQLTGDTVYITKTGSKYHAPGCRYLRKSKIPISRSEAIARGYTPCGVCGGG